MTAPTVIVKRRAGYASKAGDARRQGRIAAGADALDVKLQECGGHIEARLGVVTVGTVTANPAGGGFFHAVFLPGMERMPRPAADADKAVAALLYRIRQWCEAARLMSLRDAS